MCMTVRNRLQLLHQTAEKVNNYQIPISAAFATNYLTTILKPLKFKYVVLDKNDSVSYICVVILRIQQNQR